MTREDPAERAERITRELRAATAEAAGVLKDLVKATNRGQNEITEWSIQKVDAFISQATKLIRDTAAEEGRRVTVVLQEQLQAGCERADAHIRKDYQLSAVVERVTHQVIAELSVLGYDFTQPHE